MSNTPEQRARDLLERLEHPEAQSLSAGKVVELANLIAENERLKEAMKGWASYAWKDGCYVDDVQEYFDAVLEGKEKTSLTGVDTWEFTNP